MRPATVICSEGLWSSGHGPQHPLKPERLQRTHDLLAAYGAFSPPGAPAVPARPATDDELRMFHTPDYLVAVRDLSAGNFEQSGWMYGFGPGDNPVWPEMDQVERLKAGSAIQAAELVAAGKVDVAFAFAGGMHHAHANRASGFCVFNDPVLAIHYLLRQGMRVAYIDIDAHHGDGVQAAFYTSDQVLTISLHESGQFLFPGTGFTHETGSGAGDGYAANVPLAPYTDDETYLWAFREVVPPLIHRFQPDVIVSQLGVDTHYDDPLTHLMLSTQGFAAVVETIRDLAPRWVALGGGGYALDVVPRAWTLAYGLMRGEPFPDDLPPAYTSRYGGHRLHDSDRPQLDPGSQAKVRRYAEAQVNDLKRRLNL